VSEFLHSVYLIFQTVLL